MWRMPPQPTPGAAWEGAFLDTTHVNAGLPSKQRHRAWACAGAQLVAGPEPAGWQLHPGRGGGRAEGCELHNLCAESLTALTHVQRFKGTGSSPMHLLSQPIHRCAHLQGMGRTSVESQTYRTASEGSRRSTASTCREGGTSCEGPAGRHP
jgi:hypothetical protein